MKKILFVAAVAVFGLTNVNAQEFSFGAKAGLNVASLSGDAAEQLDARVGFHLGAVAEFKFTDALSLQPEILYSQQGAKLGESTTQLDYVSIPVLVKYYFFEGFSAEAGPVVGINVVAQQDFDGETVDIEDVETLDVGAAIGAGYELPMGLFFQARYAIGFMETFPDSETTNGVFQLSVGYKFF